jgi:hypothetical protein
MESELTSFKVPSTSTNGPVPMPSTAEEEMGNKENTNNSRRDQQQQQQNSEEAKVEETQNVVDVVNDSSG